MTEQLVLERELERRPLAGTRFTYQGEQLFHNEHPVSDYALERVSSMMGIPSKFVPKCSPDLSVRILREFLGRNERETSYILDGEGNIASFCWTDYVYIPLTTILEAIRTALPGENMSITKSRPGISSYTAFITSEDAFQVAKGDEVHFGIALNSSLDGASSTKALLSFIRPTCTNGAYITEASWSLPRRSLRQPEVAALQIADSARTLFSMREVWQNNMTTLATQEIDRPMERLLDYLRYMGISPRASDFVLEAYTEEPNPTSWGMLNAFTRAANEVTDLRLAQALWGSAGQVVVKGGVPCHTCGAVINGGHSH